MPVSKMILSNIQKQIDDVYELAGDGVMVSTSTRRPTEHRDCEQQVCKDCPGSKHWNTCENNNLCRIWRKKGKEMV